MSKFINLAIQASVVGLMAAQLTACGGSGISDLDNARSAAAVLGSDGSGTWTVVKAPSKIRYYSVFQGPDGQYYALNTSKFTAGMTKDQYLAVDVVYSGLAHGQVYETESVPDGTDENGQQVYTTYQELVDIYTDPGTGQVFEVGSQGSKDLEAVSAKIAQVGVNGIRDLLVSSYGLSEDRAATIASLANSWKNLSKTRTMTAKDMAEFQTQIFGVDLEKISQAAKKAADGDAQDYNSLLQKAAAQNAISPEQAKSIIDGFVN